MELRDTFNNAGEQKKIFKEWIFIFELLLNDPILIRNPLLKKLAPS